MDVDEHTGQKGASNFDPENATSSKLKEHPLLREISYSNDKAMPSSSKTPIKSSEQELLQEPDTVSQNEFQFIEIGNSIKARCNEEGHHDSLVEKYSEGPIATDLQGRNVEEVMLKKLNMSDLCAAASYHAACNRNNEDDKYADFEWSEEEDEDSFSENPIFQQAIRNMIAKFDKSRQETRTILQNSRPSPEIVDPIIDNYNEKEPQTEHHLDINTNYRLVQVQRTSLPSTGDNSGEEALAEEISEEPLATDLENHNVEVVEIKLNGMSISDFVTNQNTLSATCNKGNENYKYKGFHWSEEENEAAETLSNMFAIAHQQESSDAFARDNIPEIVYSGNITVLSPLPGCSTSNNETVSSSRKSLTKSSEPEHAVNNKKIKQVTDTVMQNTRQSPEIEDSIGASCKKEECRNKQVLAEENN